MADVDFLARLADAWDGRGTVPTLSPTERGALLHLAHLEGLSALTWGQLDSQDRQRLLFAVRKALELGAVCDWVLGGGLGLALTLRARA